MQQIAYLASQNETSAEGKWTLHEVIGGAHQLCLREPILDSWETDSELAGVPEEQDLPPQAPPEGFALYGNTFDLRDVGNGLNYARGDALYLSSEGDVTCYAAVPLDCDVFPPWAYGVSVEVYSERDSSKQGVDTDADPIQTIDYSTFDDVPDSGFTSELIGHIYPEVLRMCFEVINGPHDETGEPVTFESRTSQGHGLRIEVRDATQVLEFREAAGLLIEVAPEDGQSYAEKYYEIHNRIENLRLELARELWTIRQNPGDTTEEEHQEELQLAQDDAAAEMFMAIADEYSQHLAPFSPEPFGEVIREESGAEVADKTAQRAFSL